MNSFIFVSKKRYWLYFAFVFVFYFTSVVSFFVFFMDPTIFYWRAWEYFEEVVYKNPHAPPWRGAEKGDMSRGYIFSHQTAWETTVSCDYEGYRSVPFAADRYPILMVGDSNTWGSGLSDQDTIPWVLAERLQLPVFNGGKFLNSLPHHLGNPRLKDATIIVELLVEEYVRRELFAEEFVVKEFIPYANRKGFNVFDVHPRRYFLPLKLLRYLDFWNVYGELTHLNMWNVFRKKALRKDQPASDGSNEIIASNISRRAKALQALGYEYVFGIIPRQNNPQTSRCRQIVRELVQKYGVHAVDIHKAFSESEHPDKLHFHSDSHVNSQGAALIAATLEEYLKKQFGPILQEKGRSSLSP